MICSFVAHKRKKLFANFFHRGGNFPTNRQLLSAWFLSRNISSFKSQLCDDFELHWVNQLHTKLLWTFVISRRRYNTTVMGRWRILIASAASLRTHVDTGHPRESLIMNGLLELGRSWVAKGMSAVQNRALSGPGDHNNLKLIKRCTCGKIFRRWLLLVERKLFLWQDLSGMF